MNGNGQYQFTQLITQPVLPGSNRPHHHRIDDLQMRGVKRQRQMHIATLGGKVTGEAHMILHITGAPGTPVFTGKLVKQLLRTLTQHIDQHVQTATVGHANHRLASPLTAGFAHQRLHHGHQHVPAFQRETLGTGETGGKIAFQPLGSRQVGQDLAAFLFRKVGLPLGGFQARLDPAFFLHRGHVHIFGTYGAAVGLLQGGEQITQAHGRQPGHVGTHIEAGIHIPFTQLVKGRIQLDHSFRWHQIQRIQFGNQMGTDSISVDKLQNADLPYVSLGFEHGLSDMT